MKIFVRGSCLGASLSVSLVYLSVACVGEPPSTSSEAHSLKSLGGCEDIWERKKSSQISGNRLWWLKLLCARHTLPSFSSSIAKLSLTSWVLVGLFWRWHIHTASDSHVGHVTYSWPILPVMVGGLGLGLKIWDSSTDTGGRLFSSLVPVSGKDVGLGLLEILCPVKWEESIYSSKEWSTVRMELVCKRSRNKQNRKTETGASYKHLDQATWTSQLTKLLQYVDYQFLFLLVSELSFC